MSDHLGQLEQVLSEATMRLYQGHPAGVREHAEPAHANADLRRRGRLARFRSRRRWPPVALGVAALAATATAVAAVAVIGDRASAPLSGTVPSLRVLHYDVPLNPDLEAGDAGWCGSPRFSISGIPSPYDGGGACFPAGPPGTPILMAAGGPLSNAEQLLRSAHIRLTTRQASTSLFWGIVSSRVAGLSLRRGDVVIPGHDSRLPEGWKPVVAFVTGRTDPVALDSAGQVIRLPRVRHNPEIAQSPVASVGPGSVKGSSQCAIHAQPISDVTASWGVVATHIPTLGATVTANVLFSCARSWYSVKGYSEAPSAAILLGARNPQKPAPALPGLTPAGHPGVFEEDGGASGPILAKREGRAWLVVQGPSTAVDELLLRGLRAEGTAVGGRAYRH